MVMIQVSTTEGDGTEDRSPSSSPSEGVVSSTVTIGAAQAVQSTSINGQQYQIVSPAPIGNTSTHFIYQPYPWLVQLYLWVLPYFD